ncbi:MAG TPA: site-2 protease family protein [Chloroflexota bacterium]|nr:site-2 protease family protein [Chloroflexota bacterium]
MIWSIKLVKIAGIDVKVHLTFVLLLAWAAYNGASRAQSALLGGIYGVVAMLLLFMCVVLHELGHSVQAIQYGVKVRDIILLPIGGVARFEAIPRKPMQELRIAIAGPAVSFALAVSLFAVASLLGAPTADTTRLFDTSQGIDWLALPSDLAMANLILGLFNLIPAFPMDGGRIFRAALAFRLSYRTATAVAAAIGQGLALVFGLIGFTTGDLILVLVAIFIWLGAGAEESMSDVQNTLDHVTVDRAMTREPYVLRPDESLASAIELTLRTAQSDFPVLADGARRVVGLLTMADLIAGLRSGDEQTPIARAMRQTFPSAAPDELIYPVQQRLATSGLHALPVIDNEGALVGLLTATDVSELLTLFALRHSSHK